jgi:hypothetical protein
MFPHAFSELFHSECAYEIWKIQTFDTHMFFNVDLVAVFNTGNAGIFMI